MSDQALNARTELPGISFAPLSIHPDPTYYVQSQTNPYSRVRRVIELSDGGVLGVTGERGAGKSVLLNKLIHDYSENFLTVNLAAPISTSRDMEFFVMLFRHLTQRVISELQRRARTNLDDIDSLGKTAIRDDLARSTMTAVAITIVLALGILSFYQYSRLQTDKRGLTNRIEDISAAHFGSKSALVRAEEETLSAFEKLPKPKNQKEREQLSQKEKALRDEIDLLRSNKTPDDERYEKEMSRLQAKLKELQNIYWPSIFGPYVVFGIVLGIIAVSLMFVMRSAHGIFGRRLNPAERGLLIYSERLALNLDYELTRSSERGFELSPVSWLKGSAKLSSQEKARGLSLPELTASYIEFVSNILRVFPGKLLICIDELDKVTDLEQVRFILREIKGALYVKGTFYVVSISNDALRSFEGRMGDQRDIFESTFDDVFTVRPLDLETCLQILTNRIGHGKDSGGMKSVKPETLATISVFSAGNARDLVRGFRECVLSSENATLPEADEAWKILFARRFEAINDRARAAGGSTELRKHFTSLLDPETLSSPTDGLERIQNCRNYLTGYVDKTTPASQTATVDEVGLAQRFLRYAAELEILLQARKKVSLVPFGPEARNDAELIMNAYQILPFGVGDAESILNALRDHRSQRDGVSPTLATPPVASLGEPLSDRNIT
jgi:hypothetical protein